MDGENDPFLDRTAARIVSSDRKAPHLSDQEKLSHNKALALLQQTAQEKGVPVNRLTADLSSQDITKPRTLKEALRRLYTYLVTSPEED